ncbi:unnamed protein product [Larinioides sclopetarius]|uniref:Ribosomal protein L35 n=1 Tax=Larinioides sclopetarius TaxID=280406 RepID=A0AAV1YVH7_9ARAC
MRKRVRGHFNLRLINSRGASKKKKKTINRLKILVRMKGGMLPLDHRQPLAHLP